MTGDTSVTLLIVEEKDKIEEAMVRHGCTDLPLSDKNIVKCVQDVMVGEVLVSRLMALEAIFLGMNTIGLGHLLHAKPTVQCYIFPSPEQVSVDAETLKNKLTLGVQDKVDNEKKKNAYEWFLRFTSEYNETRGWHFGIIMSCLKYL